MLFPLILLLVFRGTEEDFTDTYNLIDEVGYQQVFTFLYSKREGTPAAKMEDDTPREVIQDRFQRLVDLVQKRAYEVNQTDASKIIDTLIEGSSKRDSSILVGKSSKNQTVHAQIPSGYSVDDLQGKIVPVKINEARTWYLCGEVIATDEFNQ